MLVLSRKAGERILIGDNIAITIVRISAGSVRVGIEAPLDLPIVREDDPESKSERVLPLNASVHQDERP